MSASLWESDQLSGIKKHKDKLIKLYDMLHHNVKGYTGATIQKLPDGPDRLSNTSVKITLGTTQGDLKRYADLPSESNYLFNKATMNVTPLDFLP